MVRGFGAAVRDIPVEEGSYVLRVCLGRWGCALVCGGAVVVSMVVDFGK